MQSATKVRSMPPTTNSGQPYIHWIHCNRCYETFIKKERSFFLLACQHVVCESCQVEIKQDIKGPRVYKCTVCQKDTRSVEINNTMPKNLKELFHPEPYMDGVNFSLVVNFQAGHRRRYREYLDRKQNSIKEEVKIVEQCKELCNKTFQELRQGKAELKQLVKRMLYIKQQRSNVAGNRQNKALSTSSSSSSTAASAIRSRKIPLSPGITSFSELDPKTSFIC